MNVTYTAAQSARPTSASRSQRRLPNADAVQTNSTVPAGDEPGEVQQHDERDEPDCHPEHVAAIRCTRLRRVRRREAAQRAGR